MAYLLQDLVDWIIAAGIATEDGTDIFRDYIPTTPKNVIVLQEYDGLISNVKGIYSGVQYVQVRARNENPSTAKIFSIALFQLFHRPEEEITILYPGDRKILSFPKNKPIQVEKTLDTTTYAFNVAITTKLE